MFLITNRIVNEKRTTTAIRCGKAEPKGLHGSRTARLFVSSKMLPVRYLSCLAQLILAVSLQAACAQIPTQELSQYRGAFAEVLKTSEDILIDFAEAHSAAVAAKAVPAPQSGPVFSEDLDYGEEQQPDAVEVRRAALRTIDTFNNALSTLAEGKSVDELKSSADGFVGAAQQFLSTSGLSGAPGLSSIAGPLTAILGAFEQARLRKEFAKAVKDGAPVVDRMLAALIEDRKDHLDLRRAEATLKQVALVDGITTTTAGVLALFSEHSAPTAIADSRVDIETSLNAELEPAKAAFTFTLPIGLLYQTGKPPLDEDSRLISVQSVEDIRGLVGRFTANRQQYERLRETLNSYGRMLHQTRSSLRLLVEALDKPQTFQESSEDLFAIAFAVRRNLDAFKAARAGVQ